MLASQNLGTSPRELSDPGQALVGAAIVFRVEALRESGWTERPLMTDRCGDVMTSGGDTEMVIRVRQSGFAAWYEPAARCDHLIPPERQSRGYLLRLMRGISASEPWVKWIAEGAPRDDVARAWLDTNLNRYRRQIRKTRLFEWRPDRRAFLLARREARAEGYRSLARSLEDGSV